MKTFIKWFLVLCHHIDCRSIVTREMANLWMGQAKRAMGIQPRSITEYVGPGETDREHELLETGNFVSASSYSSTIHYGPAKTRMVQRWLPCISTMNA